MRRLIRSVRSLAITLTTVLIFVVQAVAADPTIMTTPNPSTQTYQKAKPQLPQRTPPQRIQLQVQPPAPIKTNMQIIPQYSKALIVHNNQFCKGINSLGDADCGSPVKTYSNLHSTRFKIPQINFTKVDIQFHTATFSFDCSSKPQGSICEYIKSNDINALSAIEAQRLCDQKKSTWVSTGPPVVINYEYPTSWHLNISDKNGKRYYEESYYPIMYQLKCIY